MPSQGDPGSSTDDDYSESAHEVGKALFTEPARTNYCPKDMLTERHLEYDSAARLVIVAFKGGDGAWQTHLCDCLSESSTYLRGIGLADAILSASDESDRLAAAIMHTVRNAPQLAGSKEDNTHGVRGTGATYTNHRLRAACVPRFEIGPRCCLCEKGQTELCCFDWAAASQKQEVSDLH